MLCSSVPAGDGSSERVLPEPVESETPPVEAMLKAELEPADPAPAGGRRASGVEEPPPQEQLLEAAAAAAGAQEAAEPSPPPTLEEDPTMASCDFTLTAV